MTSRHPVLQGAALDRATADAVVEVVLVDLCPTLGRFAGYWRWLDEGERTRAGAFRREADRQRYVAAHGELRRVLATHLGLAPWALRFSKGPSGKPFVEGQAAERLEFSLSHSGNLGLIATCQCGPVGVDLERIRPGFDYAGIADRFFSADERTRLKEARPGSVREFFRLWTRKEALLKAHGLGLSTMDGDAEPISDRGWTVRELEVAPDYAAAVCAAGSDWTVRYIRSGADDRTVEEEWGR